MGAKEMLNTVLTGSPQNVGGPEGLLQFMLTGQKKMPDVPAAVALEASRRYRSLGSTEADRLADMFDQDPNGAREFSTRMYGSPYDAFKMMQKQQIDGEIRSMMHNSRQNGESYSVKEVQSRLGSLTQYNDPLKAMEMYERISEMSGYAKTEPTTGEALQARVNHINRQISEGRNDPDTLRRRDAAAADFANHQGEQRSKARTARITASTAQREGQEGYLPVEKVRSAFGVEQLDRFAQEFETVETFYRQGLDAYGPARNNDVIAQQDMVRAGLKISEPTSNVMQGEFDVRAAVTSYLSMIGKSVTQIMEGKVLLLPGEVDNVMSSMERGYASWTARQKELESMTRGRIQAGSLPSQRPRNMGMAFGEAGTYIDPTLEGRASAVRAEAEGMPEGSQYVGKSKKTGRSIYNLPNGEQVLAPEAK